MSAEKGSQDEAEAVRLQKNRENSLKLGALLVSMNIAPDSQVFPTGKPSALPELESIAQLKKDSIASHNSSTWYNPFSWFRSTDRKQRVVKKASSRHVTSTKPPTIVPKDTKEELQKTESPKDSPGEEPRKLADEKTDMSIPKDVMKKLPKVDIRLMTPEEVETLMPEVQTARKHLLEMEEDVHTMMQTLEDTRLKYLIPAPRLQCEAESDGVVKCYDKYRSSQKKDILHCGDVVAKLVKCSEDVVLGFAASAK